MKEIGEMYRKIEVPVGTDIKDLKEGYFVNIKTPSGFKYYQFIPVEPKVVSDEEIENASVHLTEPYKGGFIEGAKAMRDGKIKQTNKEEK
jgi:hypothetical protein